MSYKPLVNALLLTFCLGASIPLYSMQLSGFASLVAGQLNKDFGGLRQYGESWSMRTDTRFGGQILLPITESLSLTGQAVVEGYSQGESDDYEPSIDLLFLAYQFGPNVKVRAGRLRTPFFMISEHLPVGYAYPWVTPPREVYGPDFRPVLQMEGVDITRSRYMFGGDFSVRYIMGSLETETSFDRTKANPLLGFIVNFNKHLLKVRYSFVVGRSSQRFAVTENQLVPLYETYEANLPPPMNAAITDIIEALRLDDEWISYHALGFQYLQDDWKYDAELNFVDQADEGFSPQSFGAFFTVSRFVGNVECFVGGGYRKTVLNDALSNAVENSFTVIPPGTLLELDLLRLATVDIYGAVNQSYSAFFAGARWDVLDNVALKYELRYMKDYFDYRGEFPSTDLIVNRVALDLVF